MRVVGDGAEVAQQLLLLLLPQLDVARVPEAAHAARRPRDLPARGHVQSLRRLHVGGLGLVHQRELVELLDVEQRLEQPRFEDPDDPLDGGAQLPLVRLGVEARVVVLQQLQRAVRLRLADGHGHQLGVSVCLALKIFHANQSK